MSSNFVIWTAKEEPDCCVLTHLQGVQNKHDLNYGRSRAADFPVDASYNMDPNYPNDMVLVDNLVNLDRLIVASAGLKEFVERFNVIDIEYLPVTIFDHKKQSAGVYYVIHPTNPVECIDLDNSKVQWSPIDNTCISFVKKLVIDDSRIPPGRLLFRPKNFQSIALVHRELAQFISQQSFTGVRWKEIDQFRK